MSYGNVAVWESSSTRVRHEPMYSVWSSPGRPEHAEGDLVKRDSCIFTPRIVRNRLAVVRSVPSRDLSAELTRLAEAWRHETMFISSVHQMILDPSYQRIIGHGKEAIPFLLEQIRDTYENWYPAILATSGADDPVPVSDRGNIELMRAAWLNWGRQRGLIEAV